MMHFVRTFSIVKRKAYCYRIGFEIMEKLHTSCSNTFLKITSGSKNPSSYPLDPPRAISYRNHQKSLAYFSEVSTFTNVDLVTVFVLARG